MKDETRFRRAARAIRLQSLAIQAEALSSARAPVRTRLGLWRWLANTVLGWQYVECWVHGDTQRWTWRTRRDGDGWKLHMPQFRSPLSLNVDGTAATSALWLFTHWRPLTRRMKRFSKAGADQ